MMGEREGEEGRSEADGYLCVIVGAALSRNTLLSWLLHERVGKRPFR